MKKFIFTGLVVMLAVFFVTCEADIPEIGGVDDGEFLNTASEDVMISKDGSQIKLYLDGKKAPRKASRAMQSGMAQMYFDYFEVIFVNGTTIARTAWELGFPAGISGVARGTTAAPITYGVVPTGTPSGNYACMFVGKKEGRTLLGVGKITNVTDINSSGVASYTVNIVSPDSDSVTFTIAPILTGLTVLDTSPGATAPEATVGAAHARSVLFDSFKYAAGSATGYTGKTITNTSLVSYGAVKYPLYSLPKDNNAVVNMTYEFSFYGTAADCTQAIRHYAPTATIHPEVKKRTPRFMDGGAYREPRSFVDAKSTVELAGTYAFTGPATWLPAGGSDFISTVPLKFTTKGAGIFSFYLQIPVYMATMTASTLATNTAAERWYVRTGLGSELYSLDDGATAGGCVLMGVGVDSGDWLKIEWAWL